MSSNYIITIGREFGSGGLEIGQKLADKLGIKCYDKELINMVAEEKGFKKEVLEKMDEKKRKLSYRTIPRGCLKPDLQKTFQPLGLSVKR